MLLGIFIVLALLLRSLTAPLYLIFTILVSYLTTLGISYLVFQVGFGAAGLSWAVPFFSFCLLVALGVDYNIFLMTRVKEEYRPGDMTGGTARALASTGKIITSCGIIMAGTFGAMLFSPVSDARADRLHDGRGPAARHVHRALHARAGDRGEVRRAELVAGEEDEARGGGKR